MKVVHITKLPDGGATWCAMRISEALSKANIKSGMLLMQGEPSVTVSVAYPHWIYKRYTNIFIRVLLKIVKLFFRPNYEYYKWCRKKAGIADVEFFTSPLTDYISLHKHPLIKEADIIHLHWIADFVDYPSFFKHLNKPIVWTLHDENPGLGGFHYSNHLQNASELYKKLEYDFVNIKKKAIANGNKPNLVAISSVMRDFVGNNDILKDCNVSIIHNGVEGDKFQMHDKYLSRNILGLSHNKKIFLFSSYKVEDKRKGLNLLIESLAKLKDQSILLICLGNYDSVPQSSFDIMCVGMIRDIRQLSYYYSASDFFVLSSFQEAFAQTPLEAMACGTPVVAFPCSGASDLINENNGVVCRGFTVSDLYDGICKAINVIYDRSEIRKDVLNRFSYDKIALQYINLYNSLLDE